MPTKIKKRNGEIVDFDKEKIATAIFKAAESVGGKDKNIAKELADEVTRQAKDLWKETIPSVEQIQDLIEKTLMENKHVRTAKAYILYRQKRAELRQAKSTVLGKSDDTKISLNGIHIAEKRYLQQKGKTKESPQEMFRRVAKYIAKQEKSRQEKWEQEFYEVMTNLEFIPAGRILAGAAIHNQVASCFVLPLQDSLNAIFTT